MNGFQDRYSSVAVRICHTSAGGRSIQISVRISVSLRSANTSNRNRMSARPSHRREPVRLIQRHSSLIRPYARLEPPPKMRSWEDAEPRLVKYLSRYCYIPGVELLIH